MSEPQPIKVMIVDDHPIVRDGLKNMLLAFDDLLLVGEATDGAEAVACCRQHQPDVILMDLYMPVLDGLAATRPFSALAPMLEFLF